MIKELYVDIVAKELVSHKICNFSSPSALSVFFLIVASPSSFLPCPSSAGAAGCAVPLRSVVFQRTNSWALACVKACPKFCGVVYEKLKCICQRRFLTPFCHRYTLLLCSLLVEHSPFSISIGTSALFSKRGGEIKWSSMPFFIIPLIKIYVYWVIFYTANLWWVKLR